MTPQTVIFAGGYFLFFILSVFAMLWWQRRQFKTRRPFGEDLKLLRGPGETQLELSRKFDDSIYLWIALGAGIPALVFCVLLGLTRYLPSSLHLYWLPVSVAVFIGLFIIAARRFSARIREDSNRYLGYFGERVVAEQLEPLKQQGWQVFHDVPGVANGTKFNLDHVAVGPQGVFVIETKTRRKGRAIPGRDDHRVVFDGMTLNWPWGPDNHGLEQAERNAVWLSKTIKEETDLRVHVSAMLTLPGWYIEIKPSRNTRIARVTNPKGLCTYLTRGGGVLDSAKITAIASKLESRCRNVEY